MVFLGVIQKEKNYVDYYKYSMKSFYFAISLVITSLLNPDIEKYDVEVSSKILNAKYDYEFKKYWELHNPPSVILDEWKLLKSQCYAESAFREMALSPVGAKGLCQFMDATWKQYGNGLDVFNADANINASARYMSELRMKWISERPEQDRMKLAQASYNAGFGNILKSQKKCGGVLYDDIISCLEQVTGYHSKETIVYVKRIWKGYWMLVV